MMMKKLLLTACALAALAGCTKKGPDDIPAGAFKVNGITSSFAGTTQANDVAVEWTAGSGIGVYSAEIAAASNLSFKADAAGSTSAFSAGSTGLSLDSEVQGYSFYAYSPYSSGAGGNYKSVAFTLGNQTQSAAGNSDHVSAGTLMWAKASLNNPVDGAAVNFNFKHSFALLRVDLTTGTETVSKLTLKAAATAPDLACGAGSLDLSDGSMTVTSGSKTIELTIATPLPASSDPQSCYIMVLPGDHTGMEFELTLATAAGTVEMTFAGSKFEAGKVTVVVPESKTTDTSTYYSIDLSGLDFSDSFIYHAKKDDNIIAAVTNEFLGTAANAQGICVYPWIDGKYADKNIFVPKVTLVAGTDGYEAPSDNVHGGRLSIDKTANKYSYTQGTSAALNTVYVSVTENGDVSIVTEATIFTPLTLVPYVLSIQGYNYKLVKIGTQIWMAENLRTTQTNTGTEIVNNNQWNSTTMSNYCWNNIDETTGQPFADFKGGVSMLYNVIALGSNPATDTEDRVPYTDNISPAGWKIPSGHKVADESQNDFTTDVGKMVTFVGDVGDRLKINDASISQTGNNISNFSLHASGRRNNKIDANDFMFPADDNIQLWTGSNAADPKGTKVYFFRVYRDNASSSKTVFRSSTTKNFGFAVRLMMIPEE